jgi:hypothetical protein
MLHLPAHQNYTGTGIGKSPRHSAGYSSSTTGHQSDAIF